MVISSRRKISYVDVMEVAMETKNMTLNDFDKVAKGTAVKKETLAGKPLQFLSRRPITYKGKTLQVYEALNLEDGSNISFFGSEVLDGTDFKEGMYFSLEKKKGEKGLDYWNVILLTPKK